MRAARGGNAGNISEGPLTLDCFLMADNLLHLLRSPLGTKCGCRDVRDQGEYWRVSGLVLGMTIGRRPRAPPRFPSHNSSQLS